MLNGARLFCSEVSNHADKRPCSIITLGKVSKHLFPVTKTLPHLKDTAPGDVIYAVSVFVGLILWGFSIPWFIVAVMMVAAAGGFPFNMGWWGFIFPVGLYSFIFSLYLWLLDADRADEHRRLYTPDHLAWRGAGVQILQGALMRESKGDLLIPHMHGLTLLCRC